jgi:hypothetical protein
MNLCRIVKNYTLGYDKELVIEAYKKISPMYYSSLTDSSRILIQYAKHDLLTSEKTIFNYSSKLEISKLHGYEKSHSSILIDERLYEDYRKFLMELY